MLQAVQLFLSMQLKSHPQSGSKVTVACGTQAHNGRFFFTPGRR